MDIFAYKGRPITFLSMNLHIVCTNTLVQRPSCLKKGTFLNSDSRSNRTMVANLN